MNQSHTPLRYIVTKAPKKNNNSKIKNVKNNKNKKCLKSKFLTKLSDG